MPPKMNPAQAAYAQKMMQSMGGDAMKGLLKSKKLKKAAKKMGDPMMEKIAGNKNITDAIIENREMTDEIVKKITEMKEPSNPEEITKIMGDIMSNEVIMTGMMDTSSKVLKEIQDDKDMAGWFQTQVGEWVDVVNDDPEIAKNMEKFKDIIPNKESVISGVRCGLILYGDPGRETDLIKQYSFEMAQAFVGKQHNVTIMLESRPHREDTNADAMIVLCSNVASNITRQVLECVSDYDENVFTAAQDTFKTFGKEVKSRNTHFLPLGCAFAVGSMDDTKRVRRLVFAPSNDAQESRALGAAAALCEMKQWKKVALYTPSIKSPPQNIEWPSIIDKKNDYTIICK